MCDALAAHGAKVYMGARSKERATDAIRKIEQRHPEVKAKTHGSVEWLQLDLTDPKDVVESVNDFLSKENKLHVLINNAGRLTSAFELSDYGVELSVAINHIGHFVLVDRLLPTLKATAAKGEDVRILILSSPAHQFTPQLKQLKTIDDLNHPWEGSAEDTSWKGGFTRYGFTKTLNELFDLELVRRLRDEKSGNPILVMSIHPGFVATEGHVETWPWFLQPLIPWVGITTADGALSSLFAATSERPRREFDKYNGSFVNPGNGFVQRKPQAEDPQLARDLWELTERIVNDALSRKG